MAVTFTINGDLTAVASYLKSDAALLALAQCAQEYMDPFVPMRTGRLAESASASVDKGAGAVRYGVSYADEVYHAGSWRFSRERHPLATAYWDRAMIAAAGGAFLAELTNRLFS